MTTEEENTVEPTQDTPSEPQNEPLTASNEKQVQEVSETKETPVETVKTKNKKAKKKAPIFNSTEVKMYVHKGTPNAKGEMIQPGILPEKKEGDVGFDCYVRSYKKVPSSAMATAETMWINLGFYMELPQDDPDWEWSAEIRPRSSATKKGVVIPVGTIDASYRGEVALLIPNNKALRVKEGERWAQMIIQKTPRVHFKEVDSLADLSETDRGDGGMGSTGN